MKRATKTPLVLSLFDLSCNAVLPWAEAGYECWCVDIQHPAGVGELDGGVRRIGADLTRWTPPMDHAVAFVFAWPPCTHLAVSGARWFRGKGLHALADSIRLFAFAAEICDASGAPYLIENPVSTISTYWRKPDYTFHPWHYGNLEQKATCLWTGGGFVMPTPSVTEKPGNVKQSVWLMPPSAERANLRSITPEGFSRAVFEANAPAKLEVA